MKKRVMGIMGMMGVMGVMALGVPVEYPVRHDHLLGGCTGTLVIGEEGISFESAGKHGFSLPYLEIQQLGLDAGLIHLLTWEDRPRLFGKDRILRFELTSGEVTRDVVEFLESRLQRPLVTSLLPDPDPRFVLPVKHQAFFKGASGRLEIGDRHVIFRADEPDKSRIWHWEDIDGYGSTGRYQLRFSALERTDGQSGDVRHFVFALKQPLPADLLDFLWDRVHGPRTAALTAKDAKDAKVNH